MKFNRAILLGLFFSIALFAIGCGGGSGGGTGAIPTTTTTTTSTTASGGVVTGSTVSGVAAAGAPVVGYAYLKDSSSPAKILGPTPIAADGTFSFDVTGLTLPFYLQAEGNAGGTTCRLQSVATATGNTNINPLTNLAVASAAGVQDPCAVFDNPGTHPVNAVTLQQAMDDIKKMLQPLLAAFNAANVDPLSGSYEANHQGLDAVLDVMKVSINATSGSVTFTDNTTGTVMGSSTTTTLGSASQLTNIPAAAVAADIQGIGSTFSSLAAVFKQKGTGLTSSDLDPFYATNFGVHEGLTREIQINEWAKHFQGVATTLAGCGFSIVGKTGNDYKIMLSLSWTDGTFEATDAAMGITSENGTWKIKGNGYKSRVTSAPQTQLTLKTDGSTAYYSGLYFDLEDLGNNGLQSAVVTGPGLPAAGIKFAKAAVDSVQLTLTQGNDPGIPGNWNAEGYLLDDATIGSIPDNAIYTLTFYDVGNTLVESRTVTFKKRPFMRSEVDSSFFAGLSGLTHTLADKIGMTVPFTYAKPTAATLLLLSLEGDFSFSGNAAGQFAYYDRMLLLNRTQDTFTSGTQSWTPTNGTFSLWAKDQYSRLLITYWVLQ